MQSRYYDPNIGRFINSDDSTMLMQDVYNLFAYCENAPTIGSDPSGTWQYYVVKPVKVSKYITGSSVSYVTTVPLENPFYDIYKRNLLIYNNKNHNIKLYTSFVRKQSGKKNTYDMVENLPLISSQSFSYIKDMKYGRYTLDYCGCEIIATYNLLILINKPQQLPNIISEFELNDMYYFSTFTKGGFGTSPNDLYRYFKAHKIKYSKTKKIKDLKSQLDKKKSGKFIVGYWNSKTIFDGIHTVCVKKNSNSNYVTVYNYKGGITTVTVDSFIERISKKGSFIISYKF